MDRSGRWDDADGDAVWRLRITSPGARSLGLVFDAFELPAGGQVFLYDDGRARVLGSYTTANQGPSGKLAIEPLEGDAVTIEYVQPSWVLGAPRLAVGQVIHDYVGLLQSDFLSGGAKSGACYIDVNCPEGMPYQDLKRSVVRALSGGHGCSAFLVNNTAGDGTPYLMTANHCGPFTTAVVVFNYELPGCGTGTAPISQTVSGATLLANSPTFDSQLYRLAQAPPLSYRPYYAGWSLSSAPPPTPAVSISHPESLPKKIALASSGATLSGDFWDVTWNVGMAGNGSSGSPLFTGLGHVLGTTCCVSNFVCGRQTTQYGRLSGFWSEANLGQWLDPSGTGAITLDGYDPCPPAAGYCTAKINSCGGTPVPLRDGVGPGHGDLGLRVVRIRSPRGQGRLGAVHRRRCGQPAGRLPRRAPVHRRPRSPQRRLRRHRWQSRGLRRKLRHRLDRVRIRERRRRSRVVPDHSRPTGRPAALGARHAPERQLPQWRPELRRVSVMWTTQSTTAAGGASRPRTSEPTP